MIIYRVDSLKLGLTKTIDLICKVMPASIEASGVSLLVSIEPENATLLADLLNDAGVSWYLPHKI
jgi:hypothetical protein